MVKKKAVPKNRDRPFVIAYGGVYTTRRIHRKGSRWKWSAFLLAWKARVARMRLTRVRRPEKINQDIHAMMSSLIIVVSLSANVPFELILGGRYALYREA
jgi:hypothetical protein